MKNASATKPSAASKIPYKVEMWDTSRLIEYSRNARVIPASSIDKTAASILEFGFRQPIVVDERDVILAGHTRLRAAQKLKLKKVPVHVAVGLTKAQAKAYRLADNRVSESTWEESLLGMELSELKDELGFDLALTGFDEGEIAEFLGNEEQPPDKTDEKPSDSSAEKQEMKKIMLTVEQFELVQSALDKLRKAEGAKEMSDGRALELLCGDWLAST